MQDDGAQRRQGTAGLPKPRSGVARILVADRTAPNEIDDSEQDHRAEQRYDESADRQRQVIDVAARQDQAAEQRANDPDDDVDDDAVVVASQWGRRLIAVGSTVFVPDAMLRFAVVAVGARSSSRSELAAASWVSRNGSSYVFSAMSTSALAPT